LRVWVIDALVESIRELGLLQPIVITPAARLIAGERRMEACRRLGIKSIMCCVAETGE
jgi:ParB family chromosome partitioning protein